jgi:hypothetical protein
VALQASADIVSSSVVGYQKTTPENSSGYSFITPTFQDVGAGTATYNLQNLKLLGADVGDGLSDYIEVWDDAGAMTDTAYYYVTEAQGYDHDGWVTEMLGSTYVENVDLPLGSGFYLVINSGDDVQVQSAGQVYRGTLTTATLVGGYNTCGNSTPATINLQQIRLLGADVGDGLSDYIEVWDDAGAMTDTAYYYVTEVQGYDHDGWVTEMLGSTYAEGVTYTAGQGFFLVVNSGDDVQLQLPAVLAAE